MKTACRCIETESLVSNRYPSDKVNRSWVEMPEKKFMIWNPMVIS